MRAAGNTTTVVQALAGTTGIPAEAFAALDHPEQFVKPKQKPGYLVIHLSPAEGRVTDDEDNELSRLAYPLTAKPPSTPGL